ncbi:MAG: helix-turn-helix domain-containing protein [Coprococcus comes]
MSEFEKQVRHALIDRDMTMTDLANELGITISYVSDLLKGKRTNQEQLQRIKEKIKVRMHISSNQQSSCYSVQMRFQE